MDGDFLSIRALAGLSHDERQEYINRLVYSDTEVRIINAVINKILQY